MSLHSFSQDFMNSARHNLSYSTSVLCSLTPITLHLYFMHIYVLKLALLFHVLAPLNLKRAS